MTGNSRNGRRFPRRGTGLAPGEGVPEHVARRFDPNAYSGVPAWSQQPSIAPRPNAYDPTAPARTPGAPPSAAPQRQAPQRQAQRRARTRYATACLFGPPDGIVEALGAVIAGAANSVTVLTPDFGDLQSQVRAAQEAHPDRMVLILGVPLSEEALQGVWDMRLAAPPDGVLVEVQTPFDIAASLGTSDAAYKQYEEERTKMAERARALSATILGLPFDGRLEPSAIQLCELLQIED